ncbi:MAG: hypothetical protein AABN95_09115 [Acidobacteriota bacterium]
MAKHGQSVARIEAMRSEFINAMSGVWVIQDERTKKGGLDAPAALPPHTAVRLGLARPYRRKPALQFFPEAQPQEI